MGDDCHVAVLGAGPAGLAAALALACSGVEVTLIGPPETVRPPDRRTTALLGASITFLENIGAWTHMAGDSTALAGIRLVDDCRGLLRAPELLFRAEELGLAAFGANIANEPLVRGLLQAAQGQTRLSRVHGTVSGVDCRSDDVLLAFEDGRSLACRLLVAADGRNSLARKAAGIVADSHAYPQSALAVSFRHAGLHHSVSTELHRRNGPLTVVPLQGRASSLVWVETPAEVARLAALPDAQFCDVLETELQGLLGRISEPGPRGTFPLSVMTAHKLGSRRVALVGEAGHVMPPIGAQGLNLGLRDAAALSELVVRSVQDGEDPGGERLLEAYHAARVVDVFTRQTSIDLLNRSLLSDFLPPHAARGAGLQLLANVRPLRALAMRMGLGPAQALPALMQRRGSEHQGAGQARPF